MRYKLLKDWESKRHKKTIKAGTYVVITLDNELQDLIESGCIEAIKTKTKKKKNKKEN